MILLTGLGQQSQAPADKTFFAILTKPLKPHQLKSAILRALTVGRNDEPAVPISLRRSLELRENSRVLIVEDNPVNQRVARSLLERMGLRPDIASHGREALEAFERQDYDFVLMDVQMPEMNGLEATHEIRRLLPADRQPTIIAMTASAMAKDRETCINAGMDDYISKPVREEQLHERLLHWQKVRAERVSAA
jgi:CheY-like chemotaxis protein